KQKIYCAKCDKKCSGEVLRVADKHFHKACFQCCQCKKSLATGGFFTKDGVYYCIPDYQRLYGTKCAACQQYVEGEVVSTMGKTYHQKCFTCSKCSNPFKSGSKVTNTGKEVLCENCIPAAASSPIRQQANAAEGSRKEGTVSPVPKAESPTRATAHQQMTSGVVSDKAHLKEDYDPNDCAGCGELLKEGQALVALDRQWHVWCFRCKACNAVLNGEYMGKDGVPYCEKCYQKSFGVKCAYCNRFISGKVLQAGDNHHFHPTCARCTKCGDPFGDGEEMYLQGSAIWHPRCGPGPSESGVILNGGGPPVGNGAFTDTECDRISSSALSDMYTRSRTPSFNGSLYSSSRKVCFSLILFGFYFGLYIIKQLLFSLRVLLCDFECNLCISKAQTRLQREAEELEKLNSGIGSAIAKDLKEHAKYRKWKQQNLDPRNASRTPSAAKEPILKLRYESPIGASPSRNLDHQKPFYEDEIFDRSTSYRGSLGKSLGNAPSYNAIHSYRSPPRPGYGLKTTTLPPSIRNGYSSDFSYGGFVDKTHSTDLSCGKSEASVDSITDGDRRALMGGELPASSTYSGVLSYHYPQAGLIRRSLPNMAHSLLVHEPAKIYPYHLLVITNYRLPTDVDRCNLERHLSDVEFEHVLQSSRSEFYRLPQWRRNELKRRAKLF
ncbi:PREDICTED: actin-binding LIM protein 3, partial [Rhagoletis zephyria]|uniref:actin-binding LIM protein 3 n=1 Tax=Rhagoletis zephyria TaxID=28612 RepID=UPI00081131B7